MQFCEHCGIEIAQGHWRQRFCTTSCKNAAAYQQRKVAATRGSQSLHEIIERTMRRANRNGVEEEFQPEQEPEPIKIERRI